MKERGKLFYLLICLLFILLVYPLFIGKEMAGKIFALFFSGILISGVYAISSHKRVNLVISVLLAFPALVLMWTDQVRDIYIVEVLASVFIALFSFFSVFCLILHIMKARKVTLDILAGAASAYLLLGISWGILYSLLELVNSGSFFMTSAIQQEAIKDWSIFNYFSFTTLTTVGYGDVIPVSEYAQSLAVLEAVTGVLFTALLISRLVGMYVYQLREGEVQKG
jgi:hypothetical protein